MKLDFKLFNDFIQNHTTPNSRSRYADSVIDEIKINEGHIEAKVIGTRRYAVTIDFDKTKVTLANCTCNYDYGGFCKHIINVMVYADNALAKKETVETITLKKEQDVFILEKQQIQELQLIN